MFARSISAFSFLLTFAAISGAQTVIPVTPCELISSPQKYDGKLVEVRSGVNIAFEDFSLAQQGCEDKYPWVWLVYGGDLATPTSSTVNDLERRPGSVLKVNGTQILLVRDAALDLFQSRLNARRMAPIGERPCYDCYLFHVTATLRGLFFAKHENSFTGYGHLGCCHLLAIQQVSQVSAERTAIPFGGRFQCASETRKLNPEEAQRLKNLERSCSGLSYLQCLEFGRKQISAAAASLERPRSCARRNYDRRSD